MVLAVGVLTVVAGCGDDDAPQMPNPAAAFCVEQGGTVRLVTAPDGSQSGICRLADGTEEDEWAYWRRFHPTSASGSGS